MVEIWQLSSSHEKILLGPVGAAISRPEGIESVR